MFVARDIFHLILRHVRHVRHVTKDTNVFRLISYRIVTSHLRRNRVVL